MLPNSLSTITDAASACKRLVPVFLADELPERTIQIVEDNKYALEVKNASFEWEAGSQRTGGKAKRKEEKSEKAELEEEKPFRLEDISLSVPSGSLLCVVGTVGSGKSSLLQGLVGEMRRTDGMVTFGMSSFSFRTIIGTSPSSLPSRISTGGRIGYCAQQAWILNATIRDNILFGRALDEKR